MHAQIKAKIKEAMIAKDSVALNVYRGISSAFTNEVMAKGGTPQDMLGDDECLVVLKRLSKQRKDSIEQFEKGGRPELAEAEKEELVLIEKLLPQTMGQDEIRKIAVAKKAEMNVTDKSKAGILTGAVMKEAKGQADGADVKAVVDSLFE